jgi:hypothetical protein
MMPINFNTTKATPKRPRTDIIFLSQGTQLPNHHFLA